MIPGTSADGRDSLFTTPMQTSCAKEAVAKMLARLDVRMDGTRAWDICVHNPNFYPKVLAGG